MKMIAASRLKRAQDRVVAARPYAQRMLAVLNSLAARVDPDSHPLLRSGAETGRPLLIVITADRGLCGSFNSNVIKAAGQFILTQTGGSNAIALGLIGRKGRDFFRRRGFDVRHEQVGIFQRLAFSHAADIANAAIEDFVSGQASSVHVVYNEFKSVMSQRMVIEQLLPIPRLDAQADAGPTTDYLYEPGPEEILRDLMPRHVQAQIYRALLESNAAFFAAQMTAMDAATRNSAEMLEDLTLYMNKVRQAAITREIIEVVSGAAAT
jgi:F-type H+-transporting ATPase subunit gamma